MIRVRDEETGLRLWLDADPVPDTETPPRDALVWRHTPKEWHMVVVPRHQVGRPLHILHHHK